MIDVAQCCRTLLNGLGNGSRIETVVISDSLIDNRVA